MKKFVVLLFVSVLCLLPVFSNAIEVEDEEGGVWAIFITDQNAAIPSVQNLVDDGIDINPESAVVTEYETFEEGLVRLSSAIAEKMVSILYDFGSGSYMGVYQYDGAEGNMPSQHLFRKIREQHSIILLHSSSAALNMILSL